jgi:6-phosphogluconolactonase (cycloisomerase 2 family)
MSEFKSWLMVYRYQPQTIFKLLCLEQVTIIPQNYDFRNEAINITIT